MALLPGTRLGSYEIAAQIGEGGVGEVYRATDSNLKREVAVQVLPEVLASNAMRFARFQREAEVLASLNHANIAVIYGLEDADGSKVIVMELVEGPTLADRIAQAAIPVDEALSIAKQIAQGLEAAHQEGIIHGDLRADNVKVGPDGTVKIFDVGLASAIGSGTVVAPSPYMAPEQRRGEPATAHSDVWALGVVLYEMVTGVKPLEGGIQFELGSAILGRLPSPLPAEASSVRRKVAQLGTAVERCLAKAPDARYHRASDVRGALEAVQAHADEASDSAWKYILSRKRVVGAVEAVMAEGERRIRRDRRVRADRRKEQLGPPNGIERRRSERRTGRERRAS